MEWKKFTIHTTTEAQDLVSGILLELGIAGIEIEDRLPLSDADRERLYIDILPDLGPEDGACKISFYIEETEDETELLAQMREQLEACRDFARVGEGRITESVSREEDWRDNWKQYFKPFCVGRFLIRPTWEQGEEDGGKTVIEIDPQTAFGTGQHESTRLCIKALEAEIQPGMHVLDLGCGSGILSIASQKLGADFVAAMDIDPHAVQIAAGNLERNHVGKEKWALFTGNLLEEPELAEQLGREAFDIVVANIFADIIIPLTEHVVPLLKPGGRYITSGILADRLEEVRRAMEDNGLKVISVDQEKDWVCVMAQKI